MNPNLKITDKTIINHVLDSVEYGTLAVCDDTIPYAVPVNFVRIDDDIYFHGALSNKKMKILHKNPKVSFSVVENYALIASYFSSTEGLACPATQFFKSVSIEGVTHMVKGREEKAQVFEALMKKLQPEGKYQPFSDEDYDTAIKTTAVVKIVPSSTRAKFKFGQHLTNDRFEMILSHLEERDTDIDRATIEMMQTQRKNNGV
jgi:nitroimidazol reductase NimA-like FMN-containing flavoprotein (pyridoxamine 5'-phosphate oxidase superfamily)